MPVYVVSGDEPLQLNEALDQIRQAARKAGFLSREVLEADAHFDWQRLQAEAQAMSLFADRKIIDLRLPGGKPGTVGAKALVAYAQQPAPDTLLLLSLPKVPLSSKWIKSLDKAGVLVQVWPVAEQKMPGWVRQRMRAVGLRPQAGVAELLARQTEGNLLAAQQEIEKLLLLFGPAAITEAQLRSATEDNARYDVYALVDAALAGRAERAVHILAGLRGEGVAAAVVLWALVREIRSLNRMAQQVQAGATMTQVITQAKVWQNRIPVVQAALQRLRLAQLQHLLRQCAVIDASIKGVGEADEWLLLEQLTLSMAGVAVLGDAVRHV